MVVRWGLVCATKYGSKRGIVVLRLGALKPRAIPTFQFHQVNAELVWRGFHKKYGFHYFLQTVKMPSMDKARKLVRKFGKRLRQLRQERGWTQQDLAILLEVEQSYISGVERGIYSPSLSKLGLLAECLGLTVAEMFEGM
ncbi:unnamed protein product [Sphagnum balticum]